MSKLRVNNIEPFSSDQVAVSGLGIYLPKITTAQRNSIVSLQDGLIIYNVDTRSVEHYNGATFSWSSVNGLESLNGLFAKHQLLTNGTSGSNPNWTSAGGTHTLNIPVARGANVNAGLVSHDDWSLFAESTSRGVIAGGSMHSASGLTVVLDSGYGYVETTGNVPLRFDWPTGTLTVPANQASYVFLNGFGTIQFSPVVPDTHTNILLGRVVTDTTSIIFIDNSPLDAKHIANNIEEFHRDALGAVYASGSLVSEVGTRNLQVTPGKYFLSGNRFDPAGGNPIAWKAFKRDGMGGYTWTGETVVDNTSYDNGSGTLASLTSGYYVKHSLYVVGDGGQETYMLVYGQEQFSALALAEQGTLPLPPAYFIDGAVVIASIVVRQGTSSIVKISDQRPKIGFRPTGIAATTYHSGLLGLSSGDDHPQYWRNDGAHVATGDFNMGGNNITNVSNVNGVVPQTHAARHAPGGADPIATASPITQGPDVANTEGVAASVARSDHEHHIPTAVASGLNVSSTNTKGSSSSFARADHTHAIASGTPVTQTPDQTNSAGSSNSFARADHTHNIPSAAAVGINAASTSSQGSSNSFARADHTHAIGTAPVGEITTILPNNVANAGSSNNYVRGDHRHAVATGSAVGLNTSSTNTEGSSNSFARADHTHNIPSAAPITQTPDQTNSIGSSSSFARADHTHNIPTGVPVSVGTANAQGDSSSFARQDHVHQGIRSLKANATGTQRFGDIVAQQGNGLLITDDGLGNITFETNGGPSELFVTAGAGLSANFTPGKVRFEGAFSQIAAGSVSLAPNAINIVFVDTDAVVKTTTASSAPPSTIPIAHCTTNATTVTQISDRRVFLQQSRIAGPPVSIGTSNQTGSSNNYARADHVHQGIRSVKVGAGGTQRFGDVALIAGVGITVVDDGTGNFTINASGQNAVGSKGDIQFRGNPTGSFAANSNGWFHWDDQRTTLTLGPPGSNLVNCLLDSGFNLNNFVQNNIQNKNAGALASSDFVATMDNGTDSIGYIDMGINSSTNNDPNYTVTSSGDGYLYTAGGHIAIGTQSANKNIVFHTGGTLATHERARVVNNGLIVSGTSTLVADNGLDIIQTPSGSSVSFQTREIFDDLDFTAFGASANQRGFIDASINGGSAVIEGAPTANDYFGRVDCNTGITSNSTGKGVLDIWGGVNKIRLGAKRVICEQRVMFPALSSSSVSYNAFIGLMTASAVGLPTAGIFFTYTHGTNSGAWQMVTRNASTSTTINSSVVVAANTWYKLRVEINAAGTSVAFYIDKVLVGTATTNIPASTVGLRPVFEIGKIGGNTTTSRTLACDSVSLKMFKG